MKLPSRQTLAKLIFFTFVIFFVGLIALYLYNPFAPETENNDLFEDEKRGSTFSPFGNFFSGEDDEENTRDFIEDDELLGNEEVSDEEIPRLRQISTQPTVAGIFYLDQKEIDETDNQLLAEEVSGDIDAFKRNTIRYALKQNGHVFETYSDSYEEVRVTNTTVPKIGEALFVGPLRLVYRYLNDAGTVKTFSAEIVDNPNGAEGSRLQGIFLPDNVIDLDMNIAGNYLYSEKTSSGSDFITSTYLGEEKTRVFSSPLSELKIDFKGKGNRAILSTTPSVNSFGQISELSTETGTIRSLVSGQRALSGLANSNLSKLAVTSKVSGRHILQIRDSETGEFFDTGLETFTEKCVWSLDNENLYCAVPENRILETAPDTWYQGIDTYTDTLWVINSRTQSFEILASPFQLAEEEIDMIDLNLSGDEQFIHFINKKDLTLWSYKLK